jgi:hypothetical protein
MVSTHRRREHIRLSSAECRKHGRDISHVEHLGAARPFSIRRTVTRDDGSWRTLLRKHRASSMDIDGSDAVVRMMGAVAVA